MAALGWTARQFMNSTNYEIFAAYEAWGSMNSIKKES
jgi:hypothetical protein